MKVSVLALALTVMFAAPSFAEENKTSSDPAKMTSTVEKKSRKKKVEMCSECGKPESECECHDEKKDKKAEDKK